MSADQRHESRHDVHQWEQTVDIADTGNVLTANLSDVGTPGDVFTDLHAADGVVRSWVRVQIISGSVGARWAYWDKAASSGEAVQYRVVADKIFNSNATHFAGLLHVPYAGIDVAAHHGDCTAQCHVRTRA